MAARIPRPGKPWTPDKVRERIKVALILNRLQDHVHGRCEMSPTQVQAAQILLKKAIPDLQSSTLNVTVTEHVMHYGEYLAQAPAVSEKPEASVQ